MTQAQLYTLLQSLKLPVAYRVFLEPQQPPFICYTFLGNDDLMADNINAISRDAFHIELYTDTKDLATEASIEALLKENAFSYRKYSAWIESEKTEETIYEIQITN